MENLNLKIEKAEGELVIRTGAAEVIKDPKPVRFSGTFDAVINWWNIRKLDVAKEVVNLSYLIFNKQAMTIDLVVNEQKDYQDNLKGQIKENEDFKGFGINKDTKWTIESFKKHIRLKKHLFHSPEEFNTLIKELTSYNSTVSTSVEKSSDNRGNANASLVREVKTNIPNSFQLLVAPYKGYRKLQFSVELYIESDGVTAQIILFSAELEDSLLKLQEEIFAETLSHFDGIPLMEQ